MCLTIMGLNICVNLSVRKTDTSGTRRYDEVWLERAKQETFMRAVLHAGMLSH